MACMPGVSKSRKECQEKILVSHFSCFRQGFSLCLLQPRFPSSLSIELPYPLHKPNLSTRQEGKLTHAISPSISLHTLFLLPTLRPPLLFSSEVFCKQES
ncbi:hypothetical protein L873DRAFT_31648 [Choiromyces venosus 120613-1]|uniref:Uncharacterized protein n=1 Tax=Choiromyces venosus 120613-1 TaxID=1336337 RepID=A0A3N4KCS9_9PEZI|nr:hypothetical protein L873DRAFT_31648 [Choiromyces venosus 120613-1]